jgi:hypothetical protein
MSPRPGVLPPDGTTYVLWWNYSQGWELMQVGEPYGCLPVEATAGTCAEDLAVLADHALGYPVRLVFQRSEPTPGYFVIPAGG